MTQVVTLILKIQLDEVTSLRRSRNRPTNLAVNPHVFLENPSRSVILRPEIREVANDGIRMMESGACHGFLVIDKPRGMTSRAVVDQLKARFRRALDWGTRGHSTHWQLEC